MAVTSKWRRDVTNEEDIFKRAVRRLARLYEAARSEGAPINDECYPGPRKIREWLGRPARFHDNLSGRESRWRREVLQGERGWRYRSDLHMYRYQP